MPEIMTTKEAAEYLRTTPDTVKRLARRGDLPAAKLGRGWRFRKPDLDEWLHNGGTRYEDVVDEGMVIVTRERMAAGGKSIPLAEVRARLGL